MGRTNDVGYVADTARSDTDRYRRPADGARAHVVRVVAPRAANAAGVLDWQGGTYLAADLAGFHVYGTPAPAAVVDYTTPIATITAYPAGISTDGFGMGGFGMGGFGSSASTYTWTSGPLAGGTWNFGVKPFDAAGNEGMPSTSSVSISAPPRPPAAFIGTTQRLQYVYVPATFVVTLNWMPSAA